jgi:glycosyltransferase involved in cell wall biosynthesis
MAESLRDLQATLLHAHYGPVALRALPVARALGLPLIATFHGFDMSSLPAVDPSYRRELPRLFLSLRRVVAVSRVVRDRLVALGCPPERIVVLPLGVPVSPPSPPRAAGPAVRVLTVARLHPKKGVPDLVDAVAKARALGAPLELDIVGDGPERAAVERRIDAGGLRGTARVHGALPPADVQGLLAEADAFVLNSRTAPDGDIEALGISILEAMERGLCVIGARHGGIPEVVEDGVTGLLVPERDTEALVAALSRVAGDAPLRARLGAAGRALVERSFDLVPCSARLRELYDLA